MNAPVRLTVAQALVRFLAAQHVERDGVRERFFAGCLGIFGHGNVAGLGEALLTSDGALPYVSGRNEQALVHVAAGYARQRDRLGAYAVTTSIGPGATNLVTGAALATINRLPVLLLPGDTFATRAPHPVLQQLEALGDGTVSVNDALRPVSRYFDRIERPEQLVHAALEAMRVLTDPAETGAVTLALPQDVQAEAYDWDPAFLAERTWLIQRQPPAPEGLARAVELLRSAERPLIVAGGGVVYSRATAALRTFVAQTGIPVGETHAGRGALPSDHPGALGAIGATGTAAANRLAREADVVVGIGTRWSDFTTASKSAFQDPDVRFVNVNVCAMDAAKHSGVQLLADARTAIEALALALEGHRAPAAWTARAEDERGAWAGEVARLVAPDAPDATTALRQATVIGAVNDAAGEHGVVVQAAGSMPGDLHKLWRARDPHGKSYHVEYGYSCMGYEIPGGMGVKLAAPQRPVFVLVGDGSYLMQPGELATAVAERIPIVLVVVENHGYASIGALSRSVGTDGFGTHHRTDGAAAADVLDDAAGRALAAPATPLPVDLAANVASFGIPVTRARTHAELREALDAAVTGSHPGPVAIHVEVDRYAGVPSYESWWDVPVAEVSERASVRAARTQYEDDRLRQRAYLGGQGT